VQEELESPAATNEIKPGRITTKLSEGDLLFVLPKGVDGTVSRHQFHPDAGVFTGPVAAVSDFLKGFVSLDNALSLALGTTIATGATKLACDLGKSVAGARGANPQVGCTIGTTLVSGLLMIPPAVKALSSTYHAAEELSTFIATGDPQAGYNATAQTLNTVASYGVYRWRPGITVKASISDSAVGASLKLSWASRTPKILEQSTTAIKVTFTAPGGNSVVLAGNRVGTTSDGRTVVRIASGLKSVTGQGTNGELPLLAPQSGPKLFGLTLPPTSFTSIPTYLSLAPPESGDNGSANINGASGGGASGGNPGGKKQPPGFIGQDVNEYNTRQLMKDLDIESWSVVRDALFSLMRFGNIKSMNLPEEMPRNIKLTKFDYDQLSQYLQNPGESEKLSRSSDFQLAAVKKEISPTTLAREFWVPRAHFLNQLKIYIDVKGDEGITINHQANTRLGELKIALTEETAASFIEYMTNNGTLYPRSAPSMLNVGRLLMISSRFKPGNTESATNTVTSNRILAVARAIRNNEIPESLLNDWLIAKQLPFLKNENGRHAAVIKVLPRGQTKPEIFISPSLRYLAVKIFNELNPP